MPACEPVPITCIFVGRCWVLCASKKSIRRFEFAGGVARLPLAINWLTLTFGPNPRSSIARCPKQSIRRPRSYHGSSQNRTELSFHLQWCAEFIERLNLSMAKCLSIPRHNHNLISGHKRTFPWYISGKPIQPILFFFLLAMIHICLLRATATMLPIESL